MKKIIFLVMAVLVFAANNDDVDKKLDLILQKMNQLEQKVNQKDKEIEILKKKLQAQQKEITTQKETTQKEFAIKSCDKIKVISLKYKYNGDVIPYYDLHIVLKNTYPADIKFIRGSLFAEDKDRVKILQDYISRNVNFPKNSTLKIDKKHIIDNELENYLKDSNPKNLHIYFAPTRIEFKNGKVLECN